MSMENRTVFQLQTSVVREVERQLAKRVFPYSCLLKAARDWKMQVDLHQRLTFPPENRSNQPEARLGPVFSGLLYTSH